MYRALASALLVLLCASTSSAQNPQPRPKFEGPLRCYQAGRLVYHNKHPKVVLLVSASRQYVDVISGSLNLTDARLTVDGQAVTGDCTYDLNRN